MIKFIFVGLLRVKKLNALREILFTIDRMRLMTNYIKNYSCEMELSEIFFTNLIKNIFIGLYRKEITGK